jgi:hypothetical protein
MPILGIVASSNYQRVAPDTGAMFPLGMVQVGSGGSASISFTSIPATYKHLQIRAIGRFTSSDNKATVSFNGDTTATNYYQHRVSAGVGSVGTWAYNNNWVLYWPDSSLLASSFGIAVVDILDYTNTSKNKTVRALEGFDTNGGADTSAWLQSLLWNNTAAINSMTFTSLAGNFAQYSSFALYGIK